MVSVIIPTYNEGSNLEKCLDSLSSQTYTDIEIIVIDDGSMPELTIEDKKLKIKLLKQKHLGPAHARNLGVSKARGTILVFVDADMTFDKNFIKMLISPIISGSTIGTFTKEEYVSNWNNPWARCWNYYQNIKDSHRISTNHPDEAHVFRAILKTEFDRVSGYDSIGFTDDWTLSRKLGIKSTAAQGAICFHHNPDTLSDIYYQARWIGKNEFISGTAIRRIISLIKYSFVVQSVILLLKLFKYTEVRLIPFTFVYSFAVTLSIFLSWFGEQKSK